MLEWFNTLTSPEQIFWIIAIVSTVIFSFVLIGTFFGGDADGDVDLDTGAGFHFFTFKNCVAFFSIFGWVGIACLYQGYGLITSIIIAFVCGILMMFVMAGLFYYVNKMTESGTLEYKNALNSTGEVYMDVGRQRTRMGKVQIRVQGTLREMEALTDFDHDIKRGTLIQVESVTANGILIIKPLQ